MNRQLRRSVYCNAILIVVLSVYLFFMPVALVVRDLRDPALATGEIPRFAFGWHHDLSGSMEMWAKQRVASGKAAQLENNDIAAEEWPLFSAAFYLWTTESLQLAWEYDTTLASSAPVVYARGAIEAAAKLICDPNHAVWVKKRWGKNYLQSENLFYRMLLISGMTSYQQLTGELQYQSLLAEQVTLLTDELDASPYGLLDDYPGECYPVDILPAIVAIGRADKVLGTDHSAIIARAVRGFEDTRLDPQTGLPAYMADSQTGIGRGPARGAGLSFMLIWAAELWPDTAEDWYEKYERQFWAQNWFMAGFREFAKTSFYPEWYFMDADAGPVVAGYGTTASASGIGAARVNGRLNQAYALSAEALAFSWPVADGQRLLVRLFSNAANAPFVGEAILLFNLTRQPLVEQKKAVENRLPVVVYLILALYVCAGCICIWVGVRPLSQLRMQVATARISLLRVQLFIKWSLCLLGAVLAIMHHPLLGLPLILLACCLPVI